MSGAGEDGHEAAKTVEAPKLSAEDGAEIVRLLVEKTGDKVPCEMCGTNDWSVGSSLSQLPSLGIDEESGQLVLSPTRLTPLITLICDSCGNTKLFHPGRLGFRPDLFGAKG